MSRLARILSLDDFEIAARRHLPPQVYEYVAGAVEDRLSFRDNRAAFEELGFLPRVLLDVSARDVSVELFGQRYAAPFGVAPMGINALSAYRGDLVLARAARNANIPMVMSGSSLVRLEEVAKENPQAWFQAYLPGEPARIAALLDRVAAAGFRTLMVTVDVAVLSNRENTIRVGFSLPLRPSLRLAWDGITHPRWLFGTALRTIVSHGMPHFENSYAERGAPILSRTIERDFAKRDHLNWEHLAQIRKQWKGTLVVKGIMTADDAKRAEDHGVQGIVVSNHGGRQLDGTVSPLRVLPAIAAAVKGATVMMDGGIRRGTDVLKAYALGARFVFVGRPFNYAAAIGGDEGVAHAISILSSEVHRNMALVGVTRMDAMGAARVMRIGGAAVTPAA